MPEWNISSNLWMLDDFERALSGQRSVAQLKVSAASIAKFSSSSPIARQFKPTHKLVLPTNEKPQLPNDPAFRGRVYFVPFWRTSATGRSKILSSKELSLPKPQVFSRN